MFSDKSFDTVGFASSWQSSRSTNDGESQTESHTSEEKEAQATTSNSVEVQTEAEAVVDASAADYDIDRLASFLTRVCPAVLKELDRANNSRAFDSYNPMTDEDMEVKKLHVLIPPKHPTLSEVKVNSLSWSSTGSVVALGFCSLEHTSWCKHTGSLHLFNINRRYFSPTVPYKTLETTACVTSVCFHPYHPHIFAAGTFSGEVLAKSLQSDDDSIIGSSVTIPDCHLDTITQLSWIHSPDPTHQQLLLVSSGRDGRLLTWKVGHHFNSFQPVDRFIISVAQSQNSEVLVSPLVGQNMVELGVNCFSFSTKNLSMFLTGMQNGSVLHCSTLTSKRVAVTSQEKYLDPGKIEFLDPVVSAYKGHQGPVLSLQFSEEQKDMFVSCGMDREIHIYHVNQHTPKQVIYCTSDITGVQWNPFQSSGIACWGSSGLIEFYNLENAEESLLKISPKPGKLVPISSAQFSPRSNRFLAVGDTEGRVTIWQIPFVELFKNLKLE